MAIKKPVPVKDSSGLDKWLWIVFAILAVWILFSFFGGSDETAQKKDEELAALKAELGAIDSELDREEDVRVFKLEKAQNLRDRAVTFAQNAIDGMDNDNLSELASEIMEKNQQTIDEAETKLDNAKEEIQAQYARSVEELTNRRDEIEAKIAELESDNQ